MSKSRKLLRELKNEENLYQLDNKNVGMEGVPSQENEAKKVT